jgi:nucleoside-diphosphate-sugar epimerase
MLVAVTGGTGFIGSHTARALLASGHRLRLLVRDPSKMKRIYAPFGIEIEDSVVGDATDPESVDHLLDGCDALVHCAALVALERSRAEEVRRNNAQSVKLVVGGAVNRGLGRIVYVSSAGALFTVGGGPLTGESPIGESENAYGRSKAAGERYVRELQAAGAPIFCSYPTAAIGPDDPGLTDPNRAVSFFVRYGAILTSSGYQPIDVRDLARLHVALLESDQHQGRYMATGPYYEWADLCARVERVTGRRLPRYRVPGPVLRGLGRVIDAAKRIVPLELPLPITREAMQFATCWPTADGSPAERDLGIRFRDLDETLEDTLRWMAEAGHVTREQVGKLALGRE